MTCAHCCFACTSKGSDMSKEDFYAAVKLAVDYEQPITIGGGEPTLHPLFKEFILHATWELASVSESAGSPYVGVVTNGSNTDIAITLAKLAKTGVISATVSHDEYHDPVDPRVYRAFERPKKDFYDHSRDNDNRSVNGGDHLIIPVGRAKSWGNNPYIKCVCDSLFITPKGNVFPCGCKKTKIGHVSSGVDLKYEHFEGHCEKDEHYAEKMAGENA